MPRSKQESIRDQHPDTWIPLEPGDALTGIVVDIDRAWSDTHALGNNGDGFYPLLTVRTHDGLELKWHAFRTVDKNLVLDHQPRPGEAILVTYTGEGKGKPGMNKPKLFSLRMPDRDPRERTDRIYASFGGAHATQVRSKVRNLAGDQVQSALEAQLGAVDVTDGSDHPFDDD